MTKLDIDTLARFMREAALAEIMPRFRKLGAGDIRVKTEATDLVTEADESAERMMKAAVAAIAPEALFVGEESATADPTLLDRLETADLAVIVDPVDGTLNFATGMPLFMVMAAIVRKGEAIAGVLYDPVVDEFTLAEKGSGAFVRYADGKQTSLQVSESAPLAKMVGTASVASLKPDVKPVVLANLAKVRMASSFRCAGHEYRLLAAGHLHYTMFRKLLPWDHVPGVIIAQEAGAHAAKFDGTPYRPTDRKGGLLLATDKDSWTQLRDEVFPVSI